MSTEGNPPDRGGAESTRKLVSWKAIADHFGCDVRTVRRWEGDRNLPVYRPAGGKRSSVFAYASELDAWLRGAALEVGAGSLLPVDEFSGKKADARLRKPFSAGDPVAQPPAAAEIREATEGRTLGRRFPILKRRIWVTAGAALVVALIWGFLDYKARPDSVRKGSLSGDAGLNIAPHMPMPGAEEFYERGRYFWNLRTHDSLTKAIDAYTQAILRDPSYAEAYAGLAESYDLLPQFAGADLGESLTQAEVAADRAIALNPNLAAAHRAKAFALFYWDWDIAGSKAEFERALELDPGSAQTHQWYAGILQCTSEGTEAIRQIDEAVRLEPTSPAIVADAALLHADFGDFRSGVKDLRDLEQTQSTLASPAQFLSVLDFATTDFPAYVDDLGRLAAISHSPDDVALAKAVERGWARGGKTGLLRPGPRL